MQEPEGPSQTYGAQSRATGAGQAEPVPEQCEGRVAVERPVHAAGAQVVPAE